MTHSPRMTRQVVAAVALCAALLAGTVAAAPTAGAATPANTTYVRTLYSDLLERVDTTGDDAGVAYWANRLDAGTEPRMMTVLALMGAGSGEYYGNIVDINYAIFLDRTAEPAGRSFYIQKWQTKAFTLDQVIIALAGSQEYYDRQGANIPDFVEAVYFDVLGRRPDPAGRAFALDYVAANGRAQYAKVVVRSAERRRADITFAYGTFLGRAPTTMELNEALDALNSGLRRENFDAGLVSSDEYYLANS